MKREKQKIKIDTGRGYAWEFYAGLCNWAEPNPETLKNRNNDSMPSYDAKPVAVRIIKESDWRKLMRMVNKS